MEGKVFAAMLEGDSWSRDISYSALGLALWPHNPHSNSIFEHRRDCNRAVQCRLVDEEVMAHWRVLLATAVEKEYQCWVAAINTMIAV